MFGVVVDEHVVRDGQDMSLHAHRSGNNNLERSRGREMIGKTKR